MDNAEFLKYLADQGIELPAGVAETPAAPEPGLISKGLSLADTVLSAPRRYTSDILARGISNAAGMPAQPDESVGHLLRRGVGLGEEDSPSYAGRLGGKAVEFAGDIAADPLTYVGVGLAGRVAKGAKAVKALAEGEKAIEAAKALNLGERTLEELQALKAAGESFGPIKNLPSIQHGAETGFKYLAGIGGLQAGGQALDTVQKEGFTPRAAEETLGAGLGLGAAALAHKHQGGLAAEAARDEATLAALRARLSGEEPPAPTPVPPAEVPPTRTDGLPEEWDSLFHEPMDPLDLGEMPTEGIDLEPPAVAPDVWEGPEPVVSPSLEEQFRAAQQRTAGQRVGPGGTAGPNVPVPIEEQFAQRQARDRMRTSTEGDLSLMMEDMGLTLDPAEQAAMRARGTERPEDAATADATAAAAPPPVAPPPTPVAPPPTPVAPPPVPLRVDKVSAPEKQVGKRIVKSVEDVARPLQEGEKLGDYLAGPGKDVATVLDQMSQRGNMGWTVQDFDKLAEMLGLPNRAPKTSLENAAANLLHDLGIKEKTFLSSQAYTAKHGPRPFGGGLRAPKGSTNANMLGLQTLYEKMEPTLSKAGLAAREAIDHGYQLVKRGVSDVMEWSRQMVAKFGEGIRKHLRELFNEIVGAFSTGTRSNIIPEHVQNSVFKGKVIAAAKAIADSRQSFKTGDFAEQAAIGRALEAQLIGEGYTPSEAYQAVKLSWEMRGKPLGVDEPIKPRIPSAGPEVDGEVLPLPLPLGEAPDRTAANPSVLSERQRVQGIPKREPPPPKPKGLTSIEKAARNLNARMTPEGDEAIASTVPTESGKPQKPYEPKLRPEGEQTPEVTRQVFEGQSGQELIDRLKTKYGVRFKPEAEEALGNVLARMSGAKIGTRGEAQVPFSLLHPNVIKFLEDHPGVDLPPELPTVRSLFEAMAVNKDMQKMAKVEVLRKQGRGGITGVPDDTVLVTDSADAAGTGKVSGEEETTMGMASARVDRQVLEKSSTKPTESPELRSKQMDTIVKAAGLNAEEELVLRARGGRFEDMDKPMSVLEIAKETGKSAAWVDRNMKSGIEKLISSFRKKGADPTFVKELQKYAEEVLPEKPPAIGPEGEGLDRVATYAQFLTDRHNAKAFIDLAMENGVPEKDIASMSNAMAKKGDYANALSIFRKALGLEPETPKKKVAGYATTNIFGTGTLGDLLTKAFDWLVPPIKKETEGHPGIPPIEEAPSGPRIDAILATANSVPKGEEAGFQTIVNKAASEGTRKNLTQEQFDMMNSSPYEDAFVPTKPYPRKGDGTVKGPINTERLGDHITEDTKKLYQAMGAVMDLPKYKRSEVFAAANDYIRTYGEAGAEERWRKAANQHGVSDPNMNEMIRRVAQERVSDIAKKNDLYRRAIAANNVPEILKAKEALLEAQTKYDIVEAERQNVSKVAATLALRRWAARALNPLDAARGKFIDALRNADSFNNEMLSEVEKSLAAYWNDPTQVNADKLMADINVGLKKDWTDAAIEFYKSGLIGPSGQVANIGSNVLSHGVNLFERQGIVPLLDKAYSKITRTERTVHRVPTDLMYGVYRQSVKDALRAYGKEMWLSIKGEEFPVDINTLVDGMFSGDLNVRALGSGAIGDVKVGGKTIPLGEFVRMPFKMLDAGDALFKHVIRQRELMVHAYTQAKNELGHLATETAVRERTQQIIGEMNEYRSDKLNWNKLREVNGEELAKLISSKQAKAWQAIEKQVKREVFQDAMPTGLQGLTNFLKQHKFLDALIAPFKRTPTNIALETLRRTPLMIPRLLTMYRLLEAGKISRPEFLHATAKASMGTALMFMFYDMAKEGQITGSGPSDPRKEALLRRQGVTPYSLKIGKQYFSYQRFEPMSALLGFASDMAEAAKNGDTETANKLAAKITGSIAENLTNKTFMSGLEGIVTAFHDPKRYVERWVKQTQASLIPKTIGPVPVGALAQAADPYFRETKAFTLDPFKSKIPGLSETLPYQTNPTGEPRERLGSSVLERMFSPVSRSPIKTDAMAHVSKALFEANYTPSLAPNEIKLTSRDGRIKKAELTKDERIIYQRAAQDASDFIAKRLLKDPNFARLPKDEDDPAYRSGMKTQKTRLEEIYKKYRDNAKERVYAMASKRLRF